MPDQKVIRDKLIQCLKCHNEVCVAAGGRAITMRQFQRLSCQEHRTHVQGMGEVEAKLTYRCANNPKRSPHEVQESMDALSEDKRRRKIALASTDYFAKIGNGLCGWYICRCDKETDGDDSTTSKAKKTSTLLQQNKNKCNKLHVAAWIILFHNMFCFLDNSVVHPSPVPSTARRLILRSSYV
jgi:hypothetical protein